MKKQVIKNRKTNMSNRFQSLFDTDSEDVPELETNKLQKAKKVKDVALSSILTRERGSFSGKNSDVLKRSKIIFQKMIGGYAFSERISNFKYILNQSFVCYINPEFRSKFIVCTDHIENDISAMIFSLRIRLENSSVQDSEHKSIFIVAVDDLKTPELSQRIAKAKSTHASMTEKLFRLNTKLKAAKKTDDKQAVKSLSNAIGAKTKELRGFCNKYVESVTKSLIFFENYNDAKKLLIKIFKRNIAFKSLDEIFEETRVVNILLSEKTNEKKSVCVTQSTTQQEDDGTDESDNIDDILMILPTCESDMSDFV